jgi:hypothetical protein
LSGDLAQIVPGTSQVALATDVDLGSDYYEAAIGLSCLDFDGDGLSDPIELFEEDVLFWRARLLGQQRPRVELTRYTGPGVPSPTVQAAPPIVADFDRDDARELFVTLSKGLLRLEYDPSQDDFGEHQMLAGGCFLEQLGLFDVNDDGLSDLLLRGRCGAEESARVYTMHASATGLDEEMHPLDLPELVAASEMAAIDLDGNQRPELVVLDGFSTLRVYRTSDAGTFELSERLDFAPRDLNFTPSHVKMLVADLTGDDQDELVVHVSGHTRPDLVIGFENRAD